MADNQESFYNKPYISIARKHHESTPHVRKRGFALYEDVRIYWSTSMRLYFGVFNQKRKDVSVIMNAPDLIRFLGEKYPKKNLMDVRFHYPSTISQKKKDMLNNQAGDYPAEKWKVELLKYLLILSED